MIFGVRSRLDCLHVPLQRLLTGRIAADLEGRRQSIGKVDCIGRSHALQLQALFWILNANGSQRLLVNRRKEK